MTGKTVTVHRPAVVGTDAFGADVVEWSAEPVRNVLVAPSATAALGAERPNGSETRVLLHFPRAYTASLRGCRVEAYGRLWEVVGDPLPLQGMAAAFPWDRPVEAVRVDG